MRTTKLVQLVLVLLVLCPPAAPSARGVAANAGASVVLSFDTGYTISKVRTAVKAGASYIVASSYEGTVLAMNLDGAVLWANALSGFMNRDLWCEDVTGDGSDEILAANADGTLYCLDAGGKLRWKFKPDDAPMNAVCVLHSDRKPYIVCGGYDMNVYYLSPAGTLVKTVPSSAYSKEKPWGKASKELPKNNCHVASNRSRNSTRIARGQKMKIVSELSGAKAFVRVHHGTCTLI